MLRAGHVIILCVLCLLSAGVIMVNSAGLSVGEGGDPVTFSSIALSRSTLYAAIAVAAMLAASLVPTHLLDRVGRSQKFLFIGVAALAAFCLLVYVPGVGREINGARRWIAPPLGGAARNALTFQPSEVAKWGALLLLACYAARRGEALGRFFRGLLPPLLATGALAAIVIVEDLGTGVLILATTGVVLLAAGARLWHFASMTPLALLALVAAIIAKPYRVQRLATFLDPFADPEGAGYHMIQSMVAVANGRVFGRGLGFGLQKFGYLPADRSDFLFAVICEELGLMGAAVVIILYLGVLWAGWLIVKRETLPTLRLLGLGVLATLGLQALFNLAVVTGLGPTKGIALPLLSAGGTGWIVTAASLGLLISMDRRHRRESETASAEGSEAVVATPLVEPRPAFFAPRAVATPVR